MKASEAGLMPARGRFRQLLREAPLKYVNRIRMRESCGLLIHSDPSVREISRQTG